MRRHSSVVSLESATMHEAVQGGCARLCSMPRILILLAMSVWPLLHADAASPVGSEEVHNLTGLPAYPNLSRAKMDEVWKTDTMGRWCARFAAGSFDRLEVVEAWYRKVLVGASETDLNSDPNYAGALNLSGIKLALGVDSVTVFRTANQSSTSIELFRCSPPK
jgi:hypothetical protein